MEAKERNKLYKAFEPENAEIKDGHYIVPMDKVRDLYDGRYCAIAGFVFATVNGEYCVLANKRGKGTPDFQGYWNCACGYLERGENSQQGIARETLEECGIDIDPELFKIAFVQTEPKFCEHGNVTIHHVAFLGEQEQINFEDLEFVGGEADEVADVKWIPVNQIDQYQWAFGHDKTIMKYFYEIF